ncbi:MAG: SDR family NAD(P)-dependent oxidoreductase [Deltaproteobacteria bacterium]|nr:SDR family NAD(P)-dependent oxidoreductase [Deltaproteobacteria bacterium]
MSKILVTGAMGNVGQEVVRALLHRGAQVLAADRRPERIVAKFGDTVTATKLDFRDRATWAGAVEGAAHMFLMRPPAIADVQDTLNPFVDFARAQGVDHVVFLSVAGAEKNSFVPHRKVEDHLRALSDHYTNLRPGFFAQNLQSAYANDILEDDRVYVPAGQHDVNWIDVRDVAEVAALALTAPQSHRGQAYTLTGPGPVAWSVVTAALSQALGRTIRYQPASIVGYMRHLSRRGLPWGAIAVQTVLHVLLRFGQGASVDPTLERLLGHPGRTIERYIADHAHVWAKPSQHL